MTQPMDPLPPSLSDDSGMMSDDATQELSRSRVLGLPPRPGLLGSLGPDELSRVLLRRAEPGVHRPPDNRRLHPLSPESLIKAYTSRRQEGVATNIVGAPGRVILRLRPQRKRDLPRFLMMYPIWAAFSAILMWR